MAFPVFLDSSAVQFSLCLYPCCPCLSQMLVCRRLRDSDSEAKQELKQLNSMKQKRKHLLLEIRPLSACSYRVWLVLMKTMTMLCPCPCYPEQRWRIPSASPSSLAPMKRGQAQLAALKSFCEWQCDVA